MRARRLSRVLAAWGILLVIGSLGGSLGLASPSEDERRDQPADARLLFQITTDATPVTCDLFASVSGHDELTGALYHCSNKPDQYTRYTVDEIRQGVALGAEPLLEVTEPASPSRRPPVVILSAPDIDVIKGGTIKTKYLTNGITETYADYFFQVEKIGHWTSITSKDNGHTPFNRMFLKKKTSFGQIIGIKCIGVSWVTGATVPNPAADCGP